MNLKRVPLVVLAGFGLLLGACAQPAEAPRMAVSGKHAGTVTAVGLKDSLAIGKITGGECTSPLWVSKVSNEQFREALVRSLRANQLLAASPGTAKYGLNANLVTLSQPLAGFDMTVKSSVIYTLIENGSNRELWRETVSASHTATMADTPIGVQRLRFANEGSIRKNIDGMIEALLGKWPQIRPSGKPRAWIELDAG